MASNVPGTRNRAALVRYVATTYDGSTATTTDLVAAPGAGKRIVVMSIFASAAGTQTASLTSKTTGTVIYPPRILGTAITWDVRSDHGICSCEPNEALSLVGRPSHGTCGPTTVSARVSPTRRCLWSDGHHMGRAVRPRYLLV